MQNVGAGQESAVIGWPAPTGDDGRDQGAGGAATVVEVDVVVVAVGAVALGTPPPQAAADTARTVNARTTDARTAGDRTDDDRRRRLLVVGSTSHCPMGGPGRRVAGETGANCPIRHFLHSCDRVRHQGSSVSGGRWSGIVGWLGK